MIEWEEGAVCYADEQFWIGGRKNGWDYLLDAYDFQLNEPREGCYIPKSELDNEEKYNQAVEVFGLFGYIGFMTVNNYKSLMKDGFNLIYIKDNRFMLCREHEGTKTKLTFDQLMAIGELKRKMNEREKSAPKTTPDLAPDFENKPDKKRKSKEAYRILESMGAEWDNVEGKWFKKEWL